MPIPGLKQRRATNGGHARGFSSRCPRSTRFPNTTAKNFGPWRHSSSSVQSEEYRDSAANSQPPRPASPSHPYGSHASRRSTKNHAKQLRTYAMWLVPRVEQHGNESG